MKAHATHSHPRVPGRFFPRAGAFAAAALLALLGAPGCTASFDTVDGGLSISADGSVSYVPVDGTSTWPRSSSITCTPGRLYGIGCNAGCSVGSCTGDPVMRFCDGASSAAECAAGARALRIDVDDTPSSTCSSAEVRCPYADIVCPPSGSFRILARPLSDGASYSCNVAWRLQ